VWPTSVAAGLIVQGAFQGVADKGHLALLGDEWMLFIQIDDSLSVIG